jgi:4-amino-4-deoxy-L-arabinose transferase-like glycosyltransferase
MFQTVVFPISKNLYLFLLAVILCGGIFLRFSPTASFKGRGFDEVVYAEYVSLLDSRSLLDYPAICQQYVELQNRRDEALLPPTRFLYVYAGHLCRVISHESAYLALKHVSALFTTLTLFLTAIFCCRLAGRAASLGVTALMSVAMNQIHQSQHVMIDGFFTFWTLLALWSLWESLRQPNRLSWLVVYAGALAALVMTKENAFFIFVAICSLLLANRWLKFGTVTRPLVLATFAGALFGFALVVLLAGDLSTFLEMYRLLMAKSIVLPYAIMTGDGPWYRYLVDLILVSPLVVLLATGAAFRLSAEDNKPLLFLFLFFGFTFAGMASVKLGCNLRYTTIWDMPLRLLAFSQLGLLTAHFGRHHAALLLVLATVALCAFELRQYFVFCVDWPAYALVPSDLLHATRIIK